MPETRATKDNTVQLHQGDCLDVLATLPDASVQCCVTSPPYWGLRDYGVDGQLGLESTIDEYVAKMVEIFRQVRRVLKPNGVCWVNLGDCYTSTGRSSRKESPGVGATQAMKAPGRQVKWESGGDSNFSWTLPGGLKPKDLCGIPWRVALALQADGWWLRQDIIWHKPNPMPESVTDRCTKAHEYIFLLTKAAKYYYDADAIKEDTIRAGEQNNANEQHKEYAMHRCITVADKRNKRSVWTVPSQSFPDAHFAVYPEKLIEPCILAGSAEGDTVLDPFSGSGTTGVVAARWGRKYVGIELNPEYIEMSRKRIQAETDKMGLFNQQEPL